MNACRIITNTNTLILNSSSYILKNGETIDPRQWIIPMQCVLNGEVSNLLAVGNFSLGEALKCDGLSNLLDGDTGVHKSGNVTGRRPGAVRGCILSRF